jgi:hypothetical protein
MPGFLGGSTGGGTTGGEISFPKEFIDPVTKLRVSTPANLIDTDFEYGLQPTKWETLELINNTPSFFSKSGDTTIPNISSINTIQGSREITVTTTLDHGLSVGIPINVTGTKSVTADGAYIINSVPTSKTFTFLAKENQFFTASIEDLYTSIVTGEFFQGSQIRIADSHGLTTDAATPVSTLTVTTESPHGFGVNTPFYFLNLNSTISQEFDSTNTESKSFDASNNSTARTFDASNTFASKNYDFSNPVVSTPPSAAGSTIASVSTENNTITVGHTTEEFSNLVLGTPLYYEVAASAGYFSTRKRGVVFLVSTDSLGVSLSTFTVSAVPNGTVIPIESNMTGTFQIADLVPLFAGNNEDAESQISLTLDAGTAFEFDGDNSAGDTFTISGISGLGNIALSGDSNWTAGQMVFYNTNGAAATGLTNNTSYWVTAGNPSASVINIADAPNGETLTAISGGTGTQTLQAISVSTDKDIIAVAGHNFEEADMVRYAYPAGGAFTTSETAQNYYYIQNVYPDGTHIRLTTERGFTLNGSTEARAAASAQDILNINPSASDGAYWIKPAGSSVAHLTYCNMTLEGGGWTQMMKLSTNTLLSPYNGRIGGWPNTNISYRFGAVWDGWAWNDDTNWDPHDAVIPDSANADFSDIDSFSKLFHKMPFNDVMIVSINDTDQRLGWRHNATIPNMRSVTGGTNLTTYGDDWLFPDVAQLEYSWPRRLESYSGNYNRQSQTPAVFGFKVLSDRANNYGSISSYITGGYNSVNSNNVTGHGVSMIGGGGTTNNNTRWGGGIGFNYTSNYDFKVGAHNYGNGFNTGVTDYRLLYGTAVFVR